MDRAEKKEQQQRGPGAPGCGTEGQAARGGPVGTTRTTPTVSRGLHTGKRRVCTLTITMDPEKMGTANTARAPWDTSSLAERGREGRGASTPTSHTHVWWAVALRTCLHRREVRARPCNRSWHTSELNSRSNAQDGTASAAETSPGPRSARVEPRSFGLKHSSNSQLPQFLMVFFDCMLWGSPPRF